MSYPALLSFEPQDPTGPSIEVQWLDQSHILSELGRHQHRFLQLIYFEQGGGCYRLGQKTWDIQPGDLFTTGLREEHDATLINRATGWIVLFTADVVAPSNPDPGSFLLWLTNPLFLPFLRLTGAESGHFSIAPEQRSTWTAGLRSLAEELNAKQLGYKEAARAYLTRFLVEAARLAAVRLDPRSFQNQFLLTEALRFIDTHYAQVISLSDVAAALNRSSAHLTTLVRQATGRTIGEWIVERRMVEARRLLLTTEADIASISGQVGYPDSAYFTRLFRRIHGNTPLAWRRANR